MLSEDSPNRDIVPPEKYLAMSVDGNGAYVYLDPYEGGKIAVAEAARNLACSGAVPLGTTDNLNFGNPHNPELFWQLKEAVRGLADACHHFNAPVTGGNVSLYNQNPKGAIDPTPTVAMVGLIEDPAHITTQWFKNEGDAILLVGAPVDAKDAHQGLGGSAYLKLRHGLKKGLPPRCDLALEKRIHDALRGWIAQGVVQSAHDCSEGGLAVALTECCISGETARHTPFLLGADIKLKNRSHARLDALLFGETQGRIVISVPSVFVGKVVGQAELLGIHTEKIGTVGGQGLSIEASGKRYEWNLADLHDRWFNAIDRIMEA